MALERRSGLADTHDRYEKVLNSSTDLVGGTYKRCHCAMSMDVMISRQVHNHGKRQRD